MNGFILPNGRFLNTTKTDHSNGALDYLVKKYGVNYVIPIMDSLCDFMVLHERCVIIRKWKNMRDYMISTPERITKKQRESVFELTKVWVK
jgi:hypothetical protein